MKVSPLTLLFVFCLLAGSTVLLMGFIVAASVWFVAAGISLARLTHPACHHPRPVITYLPQPVPHEPLVRLRRGQFVSVPWPHTLQVLLPEGTRLQILETTPDRIRVMAA